MLVSPVRRPLFLLEAPSSVTPHHLRRGHSPLVWLGTSIMWKYWVRLDVSQTNAWNRRLKASKHSNAGDTAVVLAGPALNKYRDPETRVAQTSVFKQPVFAPPPRLCYRCHRCHRPRRHCWSTNNVAIFAIPVWFQWSRNTLYFLGGLALYTMHIMSRLGSWKR